MENSENMSKQSKENIIENDKKETISTQNKNENKEKDKYQDQGLNEVGEFIGERRIKKDPEELQHLKEVCAAFFNYQVNRNILK